VPILAGLRRQKARGTHPATDRSAMALLEAVRELVAERGRRVVVVAGADLAHVGPRFGDPAPLDAAQREELRKVDAESLALARERDARGFWRQVSADLDTRRVCGLSPIYALVQTLGEAEGRELHYEQTVDPEEGSIVSHAALAFHA
jgi:AmmeMemoRadiSam system protein B